MTRIKLDPSQLVQLRNLAEPLELCDPSGRVLGRFVPNPIVCKQRPFEPELDMEELQRSEQSPDFSTEEVLKYLESLS